MFGPVKRTLCELVLAACAVFSTGCGALPSESVSQVEAEQKEPVHKRALEYILDRNYTRAQGLLEQRNKYLQEEHKRAQSALGVPMYNVQTLPTHLTPTEQTLLALTYAHTRHYGYSESQFRMLLSRFKETPNLVVENIYTNLKEYFKTEEYRNTEKMAAGGILFYPEMKAVVAFLKFVRRDFEDSRRWFKSAIPEFNETEVQKYREAFVELIAQESTGTDKDLVFEYAKILYTLYSVKGKEEKTADK